MNYDNELDKLMSESAVLQKQVADLDETKNKLITKIVELQGAMKWLRHQQMAQYAVQTPVTPQEEVKELAKPN